MPRVVAYVLLTKNGPSQDKQERTIAAAGAKAATIYVDDMTRRRKAENQFADRALMLRQMRGGETIKLYSPGRLGIGKEDVLAVLRAIELKGGQVLDCSTGITLRWTPEIAAAASFVDRAVVEHKAMAAAAARAAAKAQGATGGAPIKPFLLPQAEIMRRWFNQADYPSRTEVARAAGVSPRTLANRFGPRGGIPGRKKGKAK